MLAPVSVKRSSLSEPEFADVNNTGPTATRAAQGLDKNTQGAVALRHTMAMAGFEMKTTDTQIGEEPAPEHAYEIPADYKPVPMPSATGK